MSDAGSVSVRSVKRSQVPERGDLARWIVGQGEEHLAHRRGVDRHACPDPGIEAEGFRRRHVVGDEHLVADARPEARRLTGLGGEACQRPVPTVQTEPRLRPAAEGDQPDTEVVALGLGVLGDESRRAEGLEEPMCRAHRQTATPPRGP